MDIATQGPSTATQPPHDDDLLPSASAAMSASSSKRISERIANMHSTPTLSPSSHQPTSASTIALNPGHIPIMSPVGESAEDLASRRRSSSRSIKRKKFDDELVDSMSTSYPKQKSDKPLNEFGMEIVDNVTTLNPEPPSTKPEPVWVPISTTKKTKAAPPPTTPTLPAPPPPPLPPPPVATSSSKKKRTTTKPVAVVPLRFSEENSYWKPTDDLALIVNVEQTNDLAKVHQGVKFSCKFSYSDIENRWRSLLYNVDVKSIALAAIRQLHPDVVTLIESKALFSNAEEDLLKNLESRNKPSLEALQELISSNAEVFLSSRTPKILLKHWTLLRHYQLLSDQTLQPLPRHESVVNFSEIESVVRKELEEELKNSSTSAHTSASSSEAANQEIMNGIRKCMLEIRMLENEIPKYQCLLDSITGIAPSDFDSQTYAVLRGRLVRYLMRSKEITIGRTTKDFVVDVDLSLEGPSTKISRLQAIISLQKAGEFTLFNSGKRPIYVDSKPLLSDTSLGINHNSLIEFSTLKFVFLINQDLISNMRNEVLQAQK